MSRAWGGREWTLCALLAALMLFAWRTEPLFVSMRAQSLLAGHAWELAIVTLPMLLVVVSGGIDLSVGSIVALAAVLFGLSVDAGAPIGLAAAAAFGGGFAMGMVNGWIVERFQLHPLIVTLATMAAFRGIAEGLTSGKAISGFPESFLALSSGFLAGVPIPAFLFLILAMATSAALAWSRWGRWLAAIGLSEPASRYAGAPVGRIKVALYAWTGLSCGLASLLLAARNNTAKADLGSGLELEAITAVVLGGASIRGGTGSVAGIVVSLALIHETREFVSWHWKQSELILIVMGLLLAASVVAEGLVRRRAPDRVASQA